MIGVWIPPKPAIIIPRGEERAIDWRKSVDRAILPFVIPMFGGGPAASAVTTWNPSDKSANITLSNSNFTAALNTGGFAGVRATNGNSSGKWYADFTCTTITNTNYNFGIMQATDSVSFPPSFGTNGWGYLATGDVGHNNSFSGLTAGPSYASGDFVGLAFDANTGKLWFSKNNTFINSGNPGAGTSPEATVSAGTYFLGWGAFTNGDTIVLNNPTHYSPPSGFTQW